MNVGGRCETECMNILTAMRERVDRLAATVELDVDAPRLPAHAARLSDTAVLEALRDLAGIANDAARMQSVLAGVAAQRSRREAGHGGLAATQGHSSPVALVQSITGGTRADARRQVRVGESLLDTGGVDAVDSARAAGSSDAAGPGEADGPEDATRPAVPPVWHEPLRGALLDGRITAAQHDAIRSGLGVPIVDGVDEETALRAWSVAAEGLADEAASLPAEELVVRARALRDVLDPAGAEQRFAQRYERRSLRMWVDEHGQHHARLAFDDEMAHWVRSLLSSALRPRRGGPRFVTEEERAQAAALADDPRTNEQLEYDLVMDTLRAGALATASDVFGARQPGVRMVVMKDAIGPRDALGRLTAVGHTEDGGATFPGSVVDRALCMHGATEVTVDGCGNPLDVGREQRLFTPRQRIALAIRDGGCLWPGCVRPASYCEAHHVDHYAADHGRTDIDRGVLLCRFHHMLLHRHGWRVLREGRGAFVLRPPGGAGEDVELASKGPWRWAWDPPPPPARTGWRAA